MLPLIINRVYLINGRAHMVVKRNLLLSFQGINIYEKKWQANISHIPIKYAIS